MLAHTYGTHMCGVSVVNEHQQSMHSSTTNKERNNKTRAQRALTEEFAMVDWLGRDYNLISSLFAQLYAEQDFAILSNVDKLLPRVSHFGVVMGIGCANWVR